MGINIRIQSAPFEAAEVLSHLPHGAGAVASFIGHVRPERGLTALVLEHFPGMTEREVARHVEEAQRRWPLYGVTIIHRIGTLVPGEAIVMVAVTAKHRKEAFAACEFLMDHLKTEAPFWKQERVGAEAHWVEAKASDDDARARWDSQP